MRLMSFALTKAQIRAGTKFVTRRLGWEYLWPGEHVMACEKVMGRRPGEPLVRIREIIIKNVGREELSLLTRSPDYGHRELVLEGFPQMTPEAFVEFFCRTHPGCRPEKLLTRIAFDYADGGGALKDP